MRNNQLEHKSRDKAATKKSLIRAVGKILAKDGFKGIGVNAVAREAGVDKVLIYRYFGGLPGLMAEYGKSGDFWPLPEEFLEGVDLQTGQSTAEAASIMMGNFVKSLRKRPVTLEILAWEMVERNELTIELEKARESISRALAEAVIGGNAKKFTRDVDAIITVLSSGLTYLLIRAARGTEVYNGIDLTTEKDWDRLADALSGLLDATFL